MNCIRVVRWFLGGFSLGLGRLCGLLVIMVVIRVLVIGGLGLDVRYPLVS